MTFEKRTLLARLWRNDMFFGGTWSLGEIVGTLAVIGAAAYLIVGAL